MAVPRRVLVIGGGIAGNALAIFLRREGTHVDLVEIDPEWGAIGSGIILLRNALTMLRLLGLWERISKNSASSPERPGLSPVGDADLPWAVGMYRPKVQEILTDAVLASGTRVRLGATVERFEDDGAGVDVFFSDGGHGRYDLVIGADGIRSATRASLGFTERPVKTGLAIWRADGPRPASVTGFAIQRGGRPQLIAAYSPTGPERVYSWIVEPARDFATMPPDWSAEFRRLAEPLTAGAWPEIAAGVREHEQVNYTLFEGLLVERPWHRGRSVLVGDAVHACPPTLAQGAAMGLEDAWVLTETLREFDDLDVALDQFAKRRYDRVRTVVRNSVAICDVLLEGQESVEQFEDAVMKVLAEKP